MCNPTPYSSQRGSSEELRALRKLKAAGRLRYWRGSIFDADLHYQVKRGDHVVVITSLLADTLIARDFIATGDFNARLSLVIG